MVLVTGASRSGTSTIAGVLNHLGLDVPQPVLAPNESNPHGFFESRWPIRFHNRLIRRALITVTDARPEAFEMMAAAVTDENRASFGRWISRLFDETSQVVVKDPRSVWLPQMWEQAAEGVGVRLGFLTMVRHPAEVVGSRSTYYGGAQSGTDAWMFRVRSLCSWVNANLGVERQTRGRTRAVVRYADLISDWRSVLPPLADVYGLTLAGPDGDATTRVDAFIDPALRRHRPTWDDMDMPAELVELAEGVWACMCTLADAGGHEDKAQAQMDELADRYARYMVTAQAVARDTTVAAARAAQSLTQAEVRAEMRAKLRRARRVARQARADADRATNTLGNRIERAVRAKVPGPVKRALRRLR